MKRLLLDALAEPFVVGRAALGLFLDWIRGPLDELGPTAAEAHFRAQEQERRRPGCWVPTEPHP